MLFSELFCVVLSVLCREPFFWAACDMAIVLYRLEVLVSLCYGYRLVYAGSAGQSVTWLSFCICYSSDAGQSVIWLSSRICY